MKIPTSYLPYVLDVEKGGYSGRLYQIVLLLRRLVEGSELRIMHKFDDEYDGLDYYEITCYDPSVPNSFTHLATVAVNLCGRVQLDLEKPGRVIGGFVHHDGEEFSGTIERFHAYGALGMSPTYGAVEPLIGLIYGLARFGNADGVYVTRKATRYVDTYEVRRIVGDTTEGLATIHQNRSCNFTYGYEGCCNTYCGCGEFVIELK